jgi:hypothetical protein
MPQRIDEIGFGYPRVVSDSLRNTEHHMDFVHPRQKGHWGPFRRASLKKAADENVDIPEAKNLTANYFSPRNDFIIERRIDGQIHRLEHQGAATARHCISYCYYISNVESGKPYPPHILRIVFELVFGHPSSALSRTEYWWTCRHSQPVCRVRQPTRSHMAMTALPGSC